MQLMDRLKATILAEAPGAQVPDPTRTPSDAFFEVQFSLRLDAGEECTVFNILRGAKDKVGRAAIVRIERRFHLETGVCVYVKLLNFRRS